VLLRYFLNDFEMVPVTSFIRGITFVLPFHMRCISKIVWNRLGFFLYYISASCNSNSYYRSCFFFIITDYDVRFTVRDDSFGLQLLIDSITTLSELHDLFLLILAIAHISVHCISLPLFTWYVKVH
jgi:hypothetical protein